MGDEARAVEDKIMSERKHVVWIGRHGEPRKRAYYHGRELWILSLPDYGYAVTLSDGSPIREKPYPSLNLAKRAGSKWLREQAGVSADRFKVGSRRRRRAG